MVTLFEAMSNPDNYKERIDVKCIVADSKIYKEGVDRYIDMIHDGMDIGTIIVVKHPTEELYAVLDGHHRFWAQKEVGLKKISCAVVEDFYGITFNLTREGWFQPSPGFTEKVRVPLIKFGERVMEFMDEFRKDPFGLQKKED